jgi:hypothetical protein
MTERSATGCDDDDSGDDGDDGDDGHDDEDPLTTAQRHCYHFHVTDEETVCLL